MMPTFHVGDLVQLDTESVSLGSLAAFPVFPGEAVISRGSFIF